MTTRRCSVCHFPVSVTAGDTPPGIVCSQCAMIADGRTYRDGSDPAATLTSGEVAYVRMRVASVRRLLQVA